MRFEIFFLLAFVSYAAGDALRINVEEEENGNAMESKRFQSDDLFYNPEDEDDIVDPCEEIYCGAGQVCLIDEQAKGYCACIDSCSEQFDPRRKVCSNHNETWSSDCALYRMRCLCNKKSDECENKKWSRMRIDYYGVCQEVQKCEEEDMEDFPRRMSEWLFNIMRDMADRRELNEKALQFEKEAEEDYSRRWTNAAVWKWCRLDHGPRDRAVSRHELFPLRAPLHTIEHCIAPFLDSCDANDDHKISLKEWTTCLQLSPENIDELEGYCDDITEA